MRVLRFWNNKFNALRRQYLENVILGDLTNGASHQKLIRYHHVILVFSRTGV